MSEPMPASDRPLPSSTRREILALRSIRTTELPAICRYCGMQRRPEQACAVIEYRIIDTYASGVEVTRGESKQFLCVDHAVHLQQKYLLPEEVSA